MMTDVRSPKKNTPNVYFRAADIRILGHVESRPSSGLLRQFVNQVMQREAPPVLAQDFLCPYRRLVQIRAGRRRHL